MQENLRVLLANSAAVSELVETRIVWNHLPQAMQRPAIVLYKISGAPGVSMRGSDALEGALVQIDIQALSVESMFAIRDAVVTLLHGYRDETFRGIILQSERQDSDLLVNALVHRSSLDFQVWALAA